MPHNSCPMKPDQVVPPELSLLDIDLTAIINVQELKSILYDFSILTNMVTALLDLRGNVIIATGWQDACTQFHRNHPKTACNCTMSDLFLAKSLKPGEYVDYKCKNGLWDVVTPLYIQHTHLGNIYTGQFFYEDDTIDEHSFIQRAVQCEFDQKAYLEAIRRIPRFSRDTIHRLMAFLVKLTAYVSKIGLANLQLEKEIAERQKAEDTAKENEAYLRTLIQTIPDLVWLKDQQGIYLACNSRFERFFGAKEKDIVGKTDYDFVDKSLADFFRKNDAIAIFKGKPSMNEEEVTFAHDGHREDLETIKTPMFRSDGRLVGVLGIGRDITERKQAEAQIHKLNAELEERVRQRTAQLEAANKELEAFSYSVSHDLRAPLRAIDGYSRILLDDYGPSLDDNGKRVCNVISNSAKEMGQLIDDLLAFSRIGRSAIRPSLVDMATLANSIFFELTTAKERKRIDFQVDPIPQAMADPNLVRQIWMNLLSNAIKFSANKERAEIKVTGEHSLPDNDIIYSVSDNGAGFNMEYANKLFGVFQRLHSAQEFAGTGVGLAIVQRIIYRHGGRIWAHGEVDKGSVFHFSLPAITAASIERPPAALDNKRSIDQ